MKKVKKEGYIECESISESLSELFAESEKYRNKWNNKYFYLPFLWYIYNPIKEFPRKVKWFFQRKIRGFDETELWDIQYHLKKWLSKRLEIWLKIGTSGYPSGLTPTKWNNILKELLWWSRDSSLDEDKLYDKKRSKEISKEEYKKQKKKWGKRVLRARGYLGKYVENLWD